MKLHLVLNQVETAAYTLPSVCPNPDCQSTDFRLHQQVVKPLKDTAYEQVVVHRYQCLDCGRTFRVYPHGVTHAHTSQRVQQLAILLYHLGLSFGAVSVALDEFGVYLSKSRVYDAVQAAKITKPHLARQIIFGAVRRRYDQPTAVDVQYMQRWLPLRLNKGECCRLVLTVNSLSEPDIAMLYERIEPIIAAVGGHVVLAREHQSDDANDQTQYLPH